MTTKTLTPTSSGDEIISKAGEIISTISQIEWKQIGNDGDPPPIDLWYALPSELDHHGAIRGALDRDFNSWQSEAYLLLFECFRAIGLDVRKATLTEWGKIDVKEGDTPEIYDEKMQILDEAVYFVFDQNKLLFNENPGWIASILEINNFLTMDSDKIYNQHRELIPFGYSEKQRQCARFDSLYFDLSSLIHYITRHYATRSRAKQIDPQTTISIYRRIMAEKIETIYSFWENCKKFDKSLKPPLAPIVRACLQEEQITKVEPSRRRDSGLIASNIRNTHPALSQRLPLEIAEFGQDRQMELMHNLPMGSVQLDLPFIEFPKDEIVPALPFFALETKDGRPTRGGRGAPIEERLFMNVLLEWGIGEDRWGLTRLNSTYGDVLSWLYPNGTTAAKKDLIPRLREGFYRLHTQLVYWDRRDWNIIAVDVFPTMDTKRGDRISFTVRMPDGMPTHSGVRVTVDPLRIYGAQSAPKFRAWGRLPFIWDKAKIKNGGKRIYATVPEVLRNKDDYLVDATGHVICTGELYNSKNGGWAYRQGDQPQKAWYHPLAIRTGRQIPNPQGDKMPTLFDSDMVKLFYDHTERKGGVFRECLRSARKNALQIEEDGWIVIWKDQEDPRTREKGWRILEPYPHPIETAKSR